MGMPQIFDYHPDTGECLSPAGRTARPDEENPAIPVVPGFSTLDAPPPLGPNQAAVRRDADGNVPRDGDVGGWQVVEDFRDEVYYDTTTREPVTIEALGPIDASLTDQKPATDFDSWDGAAGAWAFDVAAAKKAAKASVDAAAGAASTKYITVGDGQEGRYQLKAQQADAYKAAGYPADTSPYPMVQAEADATGASPQAACDNIISIRDQWVTVAAKIEKERIAGKLAIDTLPAAATLSDIKAARDAATTALDGI